MYATAAESLRGDPGRMPLRLTVPDAGKALRIGVKAAGASAVMPNRNFPHF